jgi:GntR family transcriptional regulator, transcriptional repressor for pyruvate dehydrogenase complex
VQPARGTFGKRGRFIDAKLGLVRPDRDITWFTELSSFHEPPKECPVPQPLSIVPATNSVGVRSPKTSELVARTLRQKIVDGRLKDGDFLPHETELMTQFQVSRPTMREAVRVLESERLVEVRRGSRTGARVCVPGPETVARPAALVLELSGATLADVMTARIAIEPYAARLLAESAPVKAHKELRRLVSAFPDNQEGETIPAATSNLHRRMVELSGNATLAMIAGMLHEISERHIAAAMIGADNVLAKSQYNKLLRSYNRLVELVEVRNGSEVEAHWRRHMENAGRDLLKGYEKTKVRDVMH